MKRLNAVSIGLLILATAGCATMPAAPPSVDLTGTWAGTWAFETVSLGNGTVTMTLTQKGAEVTGPVQVVGPAVNRPTTLSGIVSGNEVRLTGAHLNGTLTVNGDEMTGQINGVVPAKLTARRQK